MIITYFSLVSLCRRSLWKRCWISNNLYNTHGLAIEPKWFIIIWSNISYFQDRLTAPQKVYNIKPPVLLYCSILPNSNGIVAKCRRWRWNIRNLENCLFFANQIWPLQCSGPSETFCLSIICEEKLERLKRRGCEVVGGRIGSEPPTIRRISKTY